MNALRELLIGKYIFYFYVCTPIKTGLKYLCLHMKTHYVSFAEKKQIVMTNRN